MRLVLFEIGKLGVQYVEKSGTYYAAMKGVTQLENFKRFRRQLYFSRDSERRLSYPIWSVIDWIRYGYTLLCKIDA